MKTEKEPLLLTPGPLTTTKSVRSAMMSDTATRDRSYASKLDVIRDKLVQLSTKKKGYTSVLFQGSGTYAVEAVLGSINPKKNFLLILSNGMYGERMAEIAELLKIPHKIVRFEENEPISEVKVRNILRKHSKITHVACVHLETTTGIINPINSIGKRVKHFEKIFIVDAMSSFCGVPFDVEECKIDFLISSSNKCLQGVPGISFVIGKKRAIKEHRYSHSLSLSLYQQWKFFEENGGFRYTSPTHVVAAMDKAIEELEMEGGIEKRFLRYSTNQKILSDGMKKLGFELYINEINQSPVITTFKYPETDEFDFEKFYNSLKEQGFYIYPGKLTKEETFRIGTIGNVNNADIERLLQCIEKNIFWHNS